VHFDALGTFNLSITFLFPPKPVESSLFLSFDFNIDIFGHNWGVNTDVDFAFHEVARFVEGKLSLHLNFSLFEDAAGVGEKKHIFFIIILFS